MSTPGTILKVRGNALTIQLSNNRTIKIELAYKPVVAVGDAVPDDLLRALEGLRDEMF
jgi:hypothetical protein